MENVDKINRDRLDIMLTQLAYECQSFFNEEDGSCCKNCPYKIACDALNKIEIAILEKGGNK